MKTENMNEAEKYLYSFLLNNGVPDKELSVGFIKDFSLDGSESHKQIEEYGRDFLSDCHTERCAAKNEWMYEV